MYPIVNSTTISGAKYKIQFSTIYHNAIVTEVNIKMNSYCHYEQAHH